MQDGATSLFLAARSGQLAVVEVLLQTRGTDVEAANKVSAVYEGEAIRVKYGGDGKGKHAQPDSTHTALGMLQLRRGWALPKLILGNEYG